MKNTRIFFASLAALAGLCACKKEIAEVSTPDSGDVFTASIEDAAKTTLNSLAVNWTAGDKINVYSADFAEHATGVCQSDGVSSPFTLESGLKASDAYFAVYPATSASLDEAVSHTGAVSAASGKDAKFDCMIYSVQKAVKGSFDVRTPMCAKGNADKVLKFTNLASLVKITVETNPSVNSEIAKIVLTDLDNGGCLSGRFLVSASDSDSDGLLDSFTYETASPAVDCSSSVTLLPPDGYLTFPGGTYYVALRPGVNCGMGLKMDMIDYHGSVIKSKKNESPVQLNRNKIRNIGKASTKYKCDLFVGLTSSKILEGEGPKVKLYIPEGICYDRKGSFYMFDRGQTEDKKFTIRKIDAETAYTTVVPVTNSGSLNYPWQGTVGPDGNVYFCNKGNAKLMKLDVSTNTVSEIPITGKTWGSTMDCEFDSKGNLWMAVRDNTDAGIHVVNPATGEILKSFPHAGACTIAVDAADNVLFADNVKAGVWEIKAGTDKEVMIAGTGTKMEKVLVDGTPGHPETASLGIVNGLFAAPNGSLYIADYNTKVAQTCNCVRKLTPDPSGDYSKGILTTVVNSWGKYASDISTADNDCHRLIVTSNGGTIKIITLPY